MRSVVLLLFVLVTGSAAARQAVPPAPPLVRAGVDVLRTRGFSPLDGQRVALLTNLAARTRDGELTLDVLRRAPNVQLVALFAPEHGLTATQDERIASGQDARTGLPVHSLYGDTRRPTADMLEGVDVIVIDLPDVGARFYTYVTTMGYVLEEAGRAGVAVMVLDRPNPINGVDIEGPLLDADLASFVGYHQTPVRHGMTLGELARLFNEERKLGADLAVIEAEGWTRDRWFDQTGLPWSNPSPNIRTLAAAALYPGIGAIEWSNISVGRGTPAPFEQLGAPWIDGRALALMLNARRIPGVAFTATTFTPESSVYANEACSGVAITITDRDALRPVRLGIEVATAIWRLHSDRFDFGRTAQLLGSRETIDRILRGEDPAVIAALWTADEARWRALRATYLRY
ncbi:MAG: exo-beta-N-acetylmuramidase NamZ domain-containing protein [Vicinamibacterales bacterium]